MKIAQVAFKVDDNFVRIILFQSCDEWTRVTDTVIKDINKFSEWQRNYNEGLLKTSA